MRDRGMSCTSVEAVTKRYKELKNRQFPEFSMVVISIYRTRTWPIVLVYVLVHLVS
jgi:hypothetical protein